jgi:hypothetical protein
MAPRFDIYRQESPANCSEPDWECVRATGYEYVGSTFTDAQAAFYQGLGFEVALHLNTNCVDWTPQNIGSFYADQLGTFASAFPSVPKPNTNRTHCIAWSDWSTQADVEVANGIRFDTNYYYWPPTWVNDRPGLFTGSGIPMRFARADGTLIDCYQVTTQMTDESGQTYPMTSDSLLARALDARGYYGAFCANMHFDTANHPGSNAIVGSALARGVPVVSSRQMLAWLDGRNGSAFQNVQWSANTLSFSIAVATGARNLQGMLPTLSASGRLLGLTLNGSPVATTVETLKGMEYALFPAAPGSYAASYGTDTTPPVITAIAAAANANGSETITWTTNEASTSVVSYGTSAAALTSGASNPTLVTGHSVTLSGLTRGTPYFYRVTSADAALNAATSPASPAAPLTFTSAPNAVPVAVAAGVPATGSAPLVVSFSGAASTDANGDSLTYAWTFGDGGTATGRLASHTYAANGAYAAILTVADGFGGTDTASVAISVVAATAFPQTAVLDNFNRANGAIGANWIDEPTQFSIASNTLRPNNLDSYIEWNGATFGPNQEVFVTLTTVATSAPEHNLMLKTQGSTWAAGHIEVSYYAPGQQVTVYTLTAPATWTAYGTINGVTFTAGQQFGARALADGTVQVFRNGVLLGSTSVAGWPFSAQGGRIGLSTARASTARFDNFGGGNVTLASAQAAPAVDGSPAVSEAALPTRLALSSPFPNPTPDGISLSLSLPEAREVSVSVLDVQGREIWKLPARTYGAGRWALNWDGRTPRGPVSAGVYLARVRVGGETFLRRIAVIR